MAIKKSELYSSLWKSCDELRGSMDASQYKDYVLVLLFMKYVSDKGDKLVDIPEGGSFQDMVKLKGQNDIGNQMNIIIGALAKANDLNGIITVADFSDEEKLGKGKEKIDRLSNLIEIFENENLDFSGNRAENDDILGDAYEYLMRHFATESGKSKGQFYTPAEVSRILAKVIGVENSKSQSESIYDPTCGSGSLLLKAADESPHGISIYGQEMDNATRALAVMNMWLHGNPSSEILQGNTLANPLFKDDTTGKLKTFDYVVANPKFSDKSWTNGLDASSDLYGRFYERVNGSIKELLIPPKKNGDYAYLLHIIKSLKSKGKGAVILPLGVLFRGNAESEIRKNIVRRGYIKGIIGLPANLFYGTGIAACILVLDKEDAEHRKGIFMIDAGKGYMKDGNKNRLRAQDIHKVVDVFNKQIEIPKYSRMVKLSEIADEKNDFNLHIPRYIDSQEKEDIQDIEAHLLGGIPNRDIEALKDFWKVYSNLKTSLFKENTRADYWDLEIPKGEIKNAIFEHPEFIDYAKKMDVVFEQWQSKNTTYLKSLEESCHPKGVIKKISEDILQTYEGKDLVDEYAVYQHMMDYWSEVMQDDLYELSADGWEAGNIVKRLVKKSKKAGKEVSKDIAGIEGLEGRLIPPSIIIQEYFSTEKATIDKLQNDYEAVITEKEELLEEHDSEGEALHDVSTKTEAEKAQEEYIIQAWEEYIPESYQAFKAIRKKYKKEEKNLRETLDSPYLESLRNGKGNITQKAIKGRLEEVLMSEEQTVLENFLKIDKAVKVDKKKVNAQIKEAFEKVKALITEKPKADYLLELSIVMRYLDLIAKETKLKDGIKKALAELEIKVIQQYPKLSIEEIKNLTVDKKWMASMHKNVRTEMDSISHRLTERIKVLAERYETPMPKLTSDVSILTAKVEEHLKKMDYVW